MISFYKVGFSLRSFLYEISEFPQKERDYFGPDRSLYMAIVIGHLIFCRAVSQHDTRFSKAWRLRTPISRNVYTYLVS